MKWAIELENISEFEIERRVLKVLNYLNVSGQRYKCSVSNFDATGLLGDKLTKKNNNEDTVSTSLAEIVEIFKEDGQVFDMNLDLHSETENYKIILLRGSTINVLGDRHELPDAIYEQYRKLDVSLFNRKPN